jgi:adenylate cyclase class IV
MNTTEHHELERKYDATEVGTAEFLEKMSGMGPVRMLKVSGDDLYYRNGENVLRHRHQPEGSLEGDHTTKHVITTKRRTSTTSIDNRAEVDLPLGRHVKASDVDAFARLLGFQLEFKIKKTSWIFDIEYLMAGRLYTVTVAMYDVYKVANGKVDIDSAGRYVEVEVEKSPNVTVGEARTVLDLFEKKLEGINLGKQIHQSLYEIYSGRSYAMEATA